MRRMSAIKKVRVRGEDRKTSFDFVGVVYSDRHNSVTIRTAYAAEAMTPRGKTGAVCGSVPERARR